LYEYIKLLLEWVAAMLLPTAAGMFRDEQESTKKTGLTNRDLRR
jgi:hypothetical protein